MPRAVIIGERSLIMGFKGAGFEIAPVQDAEGFHRELMTRSRDPDVALILVTESMAAEAAHVIEDARANRGAIVCIIPTHEGSKHISYQLMKKSIERSIGVDILGKATD